MEIGPLEYIVIGCSGNQFANEIVPELRAIQEKDLIRVVDLLFVRKAADDTITVLEMHDLNDEEQAAFASMRNNLMGLITPEDIVTLSNAIPPNTPSVIILLEHLWIGRLDEAVKRANGTVFIGGMVHPTAKEQLELELAAAREQQQQQQQNG